MKFNTAILVLFTTLFFSCKSVKYPDLESGIYADIQTNRGDILLKLHKDEVPMTVANFVALAEGNNPQMTDSLKGKPYYDSTVFHRVIKDFMIQGGDITGTGKGNAGYRFPDEFPMNEKGELLFKHDKKGVLSMANSGANTNSSQFFITHKATPWLDGKHTVFGVVLKGQEIVDTIQKNNIIKHIEILRVGKDAKAFDAPVVFETELANAEEREAERKLMLEKLKQKFLDSMGIQKATETASGLKIRYLQKGKGKKVNPALLTQAHYEIYTANGKKVDSSIEKGEPLSFVIDEMSLIAGWKEGVKTMREGDKAVFFIPYYLGYGERGIGPIPPKTDLVLEVEILKVGK